MPHYFDTKVRIGIDVDGVLTTGFAQSYLQHVRWNVSGTRHLTFEDITQWDMRKALEISSQESQSAYKHAAKTCSRYDLLNEAGEAISLLRQIYDVELVFVTSPWRGLGYASAREAWLYENFGDNISIMQGAAKELLAGTLDILVDDHGANVRRFVQMHRQMKVLPKNHVCGWLFPQPYNVGEEFNSKYVRRESWDTLIPYVKEVLDQKLKVSKKRNHF